MATRLLVYLLPGSLAAVGALTALLSAERATTLTIVLTVAVVVLGFVVPPLVDWLRARHLRLVARQRLLTRRRAEATSRRAWQLRDHFEPRGRGVLPSSVRTGSYFTGRVQVLQELAGWLLGEPSDDNRARVVTGGPGSGKSAVLGRLASRADPHPRAGAGPAMDAVIAAHARGRTVDEVAADIAGALDVGEPGVAGLLAALREAARPRPAVVLADAVDEAADPYRLIVELLEPLASAAGRTGIRLVVGTRRGGGDGLLRLFGSSAVVLDLDDPRYLDPRDVEEYVRRTLLAEQDPQAATPYRERPALAAKLASGIAARAGASFLVAQLTALAVAASKEPVEVADPGWIDAFPTTIGAAMERYLRDAQPGGPWLRDLLMALAWSEGDGLDDPQTWAAVATALGTSTYTEHDVARLLLDTPAVDLLHRGTRGDRIAFRLFHEALGEHLRRQSGRHSRPAESQRRFTEVLVARVPRTPGGGPDWPRADPYTRTYLPVHAAAGRVIDALLDDGGFLVAAEPARLLAGLPCATTDGGRRVARAVERVGQQLLRAPADEQASYLEMAAHMAGDQQLAQALAVAAPERPWSVLWAHWDALDEGRLLGHHDDYVIAVSAVDAPSGPSGPSGPIVVSASAWAVRAWRLADGKPVASGMREPHAPIVNMAAFGEEGEVVVLTLHEDGELRRTVLGATAPPRVLATGRGSHGIWLISHVGQRAVVSVNAADDVEVRSAADGHPLGPQPPIALGRGRVLTAGNASGRCLLVVTGAQTEVVTWDLDSKEPLGAALRPPGRDQLQARCGAGVGPGRS
jgi:hypothetical protein